MTRIRALRGNPFSTAAAKPATPRLVDLSPNISSTRSAGVDMQ